MRAELPAQVVELVDAFRNPLKQIELLYLLAQAGILEPVLVDAETAARMVRPYAWFLDRVGTEGIKFTSHGWLPPAHVAAAVAELGLAGECHGMSNRESTTLPVLDLRESAMRLGLLRISKGTLLATPRGRKLRDDTVALWWHLAEHLPPAKLARNETHAGLLLLAATAAGPLAGPDPLGYVARMLHEAGWRDSDGAPITDEHARRAAADTHVALIRLGALVQDWQKLADTEEATRDGAAFARSALCAWPASACSALAVLRQEIISISSL